MGTWHRVSPLSENKKATTIENWIHKPTSGTSKEYEVKITNGKPFDPLSLKVPDLRDLKEYIVFLKQTASKLYASDQQSHFISSCPCCGAETQKNSQQEYIFIGIPFHRCDICGHGFVLKQPSEKLLKSVFENSEDHSSTYIDHASIENRMRQIISPKIEWSLKNYELVYDHKPITCIDVGAGGGHFVAGMNKAGINTLGYELSVSSRKFAHQAFGVELVNEDFITSKDDKVELITLWGLLEYTPEPKKFLKAARQRLIKETGMLIVEVPRLDCLGTAVQSKNPDSISRHMDPTSHVNAFTDASLATALVESGFKPVAAWYFGMDIYEFLVQIALRFDDHMSIERLADMIPSLQQTLDFGRKCDDLVIAAIPDH
jgi:2-polyprenyl-3-methyl-5-hydroxy-6-metoxy-1,4-benzoquinol methylase